MMQWCGVVVAWHGKFKTNKGNSPKKEASRRAIDLSSVKRLRASDNVKCLVHPSYPDSRAGALLQASLILKPPSAQSRVVTVGERRSILFLSVPWSWDSEIGGNIIKEITMNDHKGR